MDEGADGLRGHLAGGLSAAAASSRNNARRSGSAMADAAARMVCAARGVNDGGAAEPSTDVHSGITLAVTELAASPRECTAARIRDCSMRTRVAQAEDSTNSRTRSLRTPAKPTCSRNGAESSGTMR